MYQEEPTTACKGSSRSSSLLFLPPLASPFFPLGAIALETGKSVGSQAQPQVLGYRAGNGKVFTAFKYAEVRFTGRLV